MAACDRNYAVYRAKLRSAQLPALPYVGLFLSDLTFVHVGNKPTRPSSIDGRRQVINFDKYEKLKNIIQGVLNNIPSISINQIIRFYEISRAFQVDRSARVPNIPA